MAVEIYVAVCNVVRGGLVWFDGRQSGGLVARRRVGADGVAAFGNVTQIDRPARIHIYHGPLGYGTSENLGIPAVAEYEVAGRHQPAVFVDPCSDGVGGILLGAADDLDGHAGEYP